MSIICTEHEKEQMYESSKCETVNGGHLTYVCSFLEARNASQCFQNLCSVKRSETHTKLKSYTLNNPL